MEQTSKKGSLKKPFIAGLIAENPVFVSLLGMCPTLATTKSLESAIGMGFLVILTLMGSNVLISLLRKVIPGEVKIPCYIIIIATFVTIIKMATEAFLPDLYSSLGVFISLIVVNCIILGRAEAFASKNGPLASFMDALGSGLGFTMAISIIALIREVVGTGALSIGVYFPIGKAYYLHLFPSQYAISLFVQSAGGFLTLGIVLAFLAWRKSKKDEAKAKAEKERLEALKAQKKAQMEAQKAEAAKADALKPAEAPKPEAKEAPKAEEAPKTLEVKEAA